MSVTFEDFEIRYENIRKANPEVEECSVIGCDNPRDTTMMGGDTCCAYHRLLFDFWNCEVMESGKFHYYLANKRARRSAFTKWRNNTGKEECDAIVLKLAQEGINWAC